jgi:hypothetical protein
VLADREYIKNKGAEPWPLVKIILGLSVLMNVAVFLSDGRLWNVFSLNLHDLSGGAIWQLFTSLFLASSPQIFSFIFDILILYFAALRLEEACGEVRLKLFYKKIFGGILLSMPLLLFLFSHQSFSFLSALMLGTVCAYAWTHYTVKARFYIFFVLPLDLSGKNILSLIAVYAILVAWTNQWSVLIVYGVVSWLAYDFCKNKSKQKKKVKKTPGIGRESIKRNEMQKGFKRIVKEDLADPEIDAILDKILAQGIESLTSNEKQLLESRSSKNEIN